jgi:hypothetical protein
MLLIAFLKPRPTPNMGRNHQRPALGAFQNVVVVEGYSLPGKPFK